MLHFSCPSLSPGRFCLIPADTGPVCVLVPTKFGTLLDIPERSCPGKKLVSWSLLEHITT